MVGVKSRTTADLYCPTIPLLLQRTHTGRHLEVHGLPHRVHHGAPPAAPVRAYPPPPTTAPHHTHDMDRPTLSIHPSTPSTRPGEKTVTIMDMRGLTFFKASNLYYLRLARWYAHVSHRAIDRSPRAGRQACLSINCPIDPSINRPPPTPTPDTQHQHQHRRFINRRSWRPPASASTAWAPFWSCTPPSARAWAG